MTDVALVNLTLEGDITVIGVYDYDRPNGGVLIPPRGTSFPGAPETDEIFYRTDQETLYRWDGAAWQPINAVVSPGTIDHNALLNLTVGDPHTQYLPLTGVRPMTGDLDMGGQRIDNIGPGGPGSRIYGQSATNPASPTPNTGDLYYNTAIDEWMFFDGTRSKWLSVAIRTVMAGRNGNTLAGQGYRLINGMVITTNRGIPVEQGTIVALAVTTPAAVSSTLEILSNNVLTPVATLAHSVAGTTLDDTIDADFIQGFLQPRNAPGGATTSNLQISIQYRKRV